MNDQNCSISAETEYFWDVLKTIFDPEIGVNIVDLGLVYEVNINKQEDGKFNVNIKMTLTSPTCPLADIIFDEIKSTINDTGKASNVDVGLVFDPPWNKDMITADGKMQLGLI